MGVAMEPQSPLVLLVSISSFLLSQWLFHTGSPWLSTRLTPRFLALTHTQRTEWSIRVVSTVHAFLVGPLCLYIFLFDEATQEDPVWGDPALVKLSVGITTGYLLSDLLLMVYFWDSIGEKYSVMHHLAALYAYYYVLSQGILPYFANFRLLSEFSTPFVNQRWFLQVLGYHKLSKASLLNGVAMATFFFLARIAVIPVYYVRVYSVYGTEALAGLSTDSCFAWALCSLCLDAMNILWMVRILRGCLKLLHSHAATESESRKMD